MISITTLDYDLNGCVLLNPSPASKMQNGSRRVSRTATLDGGCSITDQGFSHGDRTLEIVQSAISEVEYSRLWYIFKTYSLVKISSPDGLYSGAIESLRMREGEMRARVLVQGCLGG